jgi:integrase
MSSTKLRQDGIRRLAYVGDKNSQCIYWDEDFPCFGVRVYPSGRRAYVCSYRTSRRKRLAILGRADALTLDAARKKARACLGQVAEGQDPQTPDDAIKAAVTVKELVELYLNRHAKAKKKSWKEDHRYLSKKLVPKLGSRLAVTITSEDISSIHSDYGATHPYAANRFLEVTSKLFNCAQTWKKVPKLFENPAEGIQDFPESKRKVFVNTEQFPKLAQAIEEDSSEYARHALWLLLLIGVRLQELLKARWSDVDWSGQTLFVGRTKNGEPVLAPLSLAAIERLKTIPRLVDNPYIICGKLTGQHLKNLRSAWIRVRSDAGLLGVRLHDLRRTVGSWLVQSGESLHMVGAVLNHKDPKTTAGYAYFQTHDRQAALDRHGAKVTRYATVDVPQKPDVTREEASIDAGGHPKRPQAARRFSRSELYELVWSTPVSSVAAKFGVSDVGLAKTCRRAGIPLPERGYWAKLAAGQPVQRRVLEPAGPSTQNEIVLRPRRTSLRVSVSP